MSLNLSKKSIQVSFFPLNLWDPFCTSTFISKFLMTIINLHTKTKQKNSFLMYVVYIHASNTLLSTFTLLHMWYEKSTPWEGHIIGSAHNGHTRKRTPTQMDGCQRSPLKHFCNFLHRVTFKSKMT